MTTLPTISSSDLDFYSLILPLKSSGEGIYTVKLRRKGWEDIVCKIEKVGFQAEYLEIEETKWITLIKREFYAEEVTFYGKNDKIIPKTQFPIDVLYHNIIELQGVLSKLPELFIGETLREFTNPSVIQAFLISYTKHSPTNYVLAEDVILSKLRGALDKYPDMTPFLKDNLRSTLNGLRDSLYALAPNKLLKHADTTTKEYNYLMYLNCIKMIYATLYDTSQWEYSFKTKPKKEEIDEGR